MQGFGAVCRVCRCEIARAGALVVVNDGGENQNEVVLTAGWFEVEAWGNC